MIHEESWVQYFEARLQSNTSRGAWFIRDVRVKIPYIQPEPDENTWLEAAGMAHRYAEHDEHVIELNYMGSRKRNIKEDN